MSPIVGVLLILAIEVSAFGVCFAEVTHHKGTFEPTYYPPTTQGKAPSGSHISTEKPCTTFLINGICASYTGVHGL